MSRDAIFMATWRGIAVALIVFPLDLRHPVMVGLGIIMLIETLPRRKGPSDAQV